MTEKFNKVLLLADYGCKDLACEVYGYLSKMQVHGELRPFNPNDLYLNVFNNGEIEPIVNTNIRNRHVFIIKSPYVIKRRWKPADDGTSGTPDLSQLESDVNQTYMEMFLINDLLRRSSAKTITNIWPFMPYQRSDKKDRPRSPIAARLFADLIEASGATRVVNINPHANQIQGFYRIPFETLHSEILFAEYLETHFSELDGWSIWSPDAGGEKRARDVGMALSLPVGIGSKDRPKPGEISKLLIPQGYNLRGNNAALIDDIGDTGGSLVRCAMNLKEQGANKVYALITHPVLSGKAKELLRDNGIGLITTNTIPIKGIQNYPNITVISVAYLLAESIRCICNGESITEHLFDYQKYKGWKQQNGVQ